MQHNVSTFISVYKITVGSETHKYESILWEIQTQATKLKIIHAIFNPVINAITLSQVNELNFSPDLHIVVITWQRRTIMAPQRCYELGRHLRSIRCLIITDVFSCFVVYYKIRYGSTMDEYEHSHKKCQLRIFN